MITDLKDTCFDRDRTYESESLNECVKKDDPKQCQLLCKNEKKCTRFTYIAKSKCCLMKSTQIETMVDKNGAVSGPKYCHFGKDRMLFHFFIINNLLN